MNPASLPVTVSSLHRGDEAVVLGFLDTEGPDSETLDSPDAPDPGALERRLAGMGLAPGTRLTVLRPAAGSLWPTLLAIGETRIALGRELSDRITVAK